MTVSTAELRDTLNSMTEKLLEEMKSWDKEDLFEVAEMFMTRYFESKMQQKELNDYLDEVMVSLNIQ